MKNFKILLISFLLLPFFSIAEKEALKLSATPVKERDSLIKEYERIIKGLKLNYVVEYRECLASGSANGIPEQKFKEDSLTYWKCYQEFFDQDIRIADWLLTYYGNDPKRIRICELYFPLWQEFLCDSDSNISECEFFLFDSRPAIMLILNYFDGKGFTCYECQGNKRCERNQYRTIIRFLKENREKDLTEIRSAWKQVDVPCVN